MYFWDQVSNLEIVSCLFPGFVVRAALLVAGLASFFVLTASSYSLSGLIPGEERDSRCYPTELQCFTCNEDTMPHPPVFPSSPTLLNLWFNSYNSFTFLLYYYMLWGFPEFMHLCKLNDNFHISDAYSKHLVVVQVLS